MNDSTTGLGWQICLWRDGSTATKITDRETILRPRSIDYYPKSDLGVYPNFGLCQV
ncbi:MAG: hypothetical protein HY327_01300 [Chloroflexi bacterium]|nr:hypothetical protein [Chloroflexota bacterium]